MIGSKLQLLSNSSTLSILSTNDETTSAIDSFVNSRAPAEQFINVATTLACINERFGTIIRKKIVLQSINLNAAIY